MAEQLNAEGIKAVGGGRWTATAVRRALMRLDRGARPKG
jgi:hypothetical protein